MSLDALITGGNGMIAQSLALDVNANNLANTGTTGFKSSRANFQDLLYESLQGGFGATPTGVGTSIGGGTALAAVQPDFSQGPLESTGRPLDVAIEGSGLFVVADSAGNPFYSRAGNFTLNAAGDIVLPTAAGAVAPSPAITIPTGTNRIAIDASGVVRADDAPVGQLRAARFVNPDGLAQVGDNLFTETGASGAPNLGSFGADGYGLVRQGFLEGSNVDATEQIIELIVRQQLFTLDAEVVRAANQRLELLTTLDS